jgi:hypothetical protein
VWNTNTYASEGGLQSQVDRAEKLQDSRVTSDTTLPSEAFVAIPPLSKDKIDRIKLAMSKITLNMKPPLGTAALLDMMDRSKIRVGDEL